MDLGSDVVGGWVGERVVMIGGLGEEWKGVWWFR